MKIEVLNLAFFIFQQNASRKLQSVYLYNPDLPEFSITCILKGQSQELKCATGCQIWQDTEEDCEDDEVKIFVKFVSAHYGEFQQKIIFDFGGLPKVARSIGVLVAQEQQLIKALDYKPDMLVENELSWLERYDVYTFDGDSKLSLTDIRYPLPPNYATMDFHEAFKHLEKRLTPENYRSRLHMLLFLEEFYRRSNLEKLSFHIDDFAVCLNDSDIKKMTIPFDEYLLEDLTKLVGKSGKALVRVNEYEASGKVYQESPIVHEAIVQEISNNYLIMELSTKLQKIVAESAIPVNVDVCFRLVDTFQPMHAAIDKVDLDIAFPELVPSPNFHPYVSTKKLSYLSQEQTRAQNVIMDHQWHPPVLLLGPFGAGKTRTIARTVSELLLRGSRENTNTRILICTHSNSAADHYIEKYFHPLHNADHSSNTWSDEIPLRINWEHRYIATVSDVVLPYCLMDNDTGLFKAPSRELLDSHRLVICTLVTSSLIYQLDLPKDYFTHIFIDEAAQAMEVEALVPLLLASKETRVVLAGDHLQVS